MFWIDRCVMNVMVFSATESLHLSFVAVSLA